MVSWPGQHLGLSSHEVRRKVRHLLHLSRLMLHVAHLLHLWVDGIVSSHLRCMLHGKLLHLLRDTGSLCHLLHASSDRLLMVLRGVHFLL
jgi:hypothetical protein